MATNFLRYTDFDYDSMLTAIRSKLQSDVRYQNLNESAIATLTFEIFAGAVEMCNHYIASQANENYLESAQKQSSAILLSRMLGYSPTRPVPAQTALAIEIKGPLPLGLTAGNILYFNRKTEFSYDGNPYILKDTFGYTFTVSDITNGVGNSNFSKTLTYGMNSTSSTFSLVSAVSTSALTEIVLLQGEMVNQTIQGVDTDLVGLIFQRYKISDTSVSNYYGDDDVGYDASDGSHDLSQDFTRVAIANYDVFAAEIAGSLANYNDFYVIDRRTLLRVDSPLTEIFTSGVPICLLKSSKDGSIEIEFGDNRFAKIGLTNTTDNVYIQYLSTKGSQVNKIGVIGDKITTSQTFVTNSLDLTSNLIFSLRRNILGGADFESIESMKVNAPSIFASLDRCVTPKDYVAYLKSLTSPIVVKNAIAWGEQEEVSTGGAIKKLFSVALFSVLSSIYDLSSDVYTAKMVVGSSYSNVLSGSVLDDNYSPYVTLPNNYFNILIKETVLEQISVDNNLTSTSKIKQVYNKLNSRSMINTKNIYVTPMIEEFDLLGTVYVKKFADVNSIKTKVNNAIYSFLNINADFDTPIYISDIISIVKDNPSVVNADIYLEPYHTSGVEFNIDMSTHLIVDSDLSSWVPIGSETFTNLSATIYNNIFNFISTRLYNTINTSFIAFGYTYFKTYSTSLAYNIDERIFYNTFISELYDDLNDLVGFDSDLSFANSTNFSNIVIKLRNSLDYIIKYNMFDSSGNIVNFAIKNQIPKVRIMVNYVYK